MVSKYFDFEVEFGRYIRQLSCIIDTAACSNTLHAVRVLKYLGKITSRNVLVLKSNNETNCSYEYSRK